MSLYGDEFFIAAEVAYRRERAGSGRAGPGAGARGVLRGIRSDFLVRRREHHGALAARPRPVTGVG